MNGFLTVVFGVHLAVFGWRFKRLRHSYDLALSGTFTALTALYGLKWAEVGEGAPQIALRVAAIGCTVTYLALRLVHWRQRKRG